MDAFPDALAYVHSTLRELHSGGAHLTASLGSLSALAEAPAAPPLKPAPERARWTPEPAPAPPRALAASPVLPRIPVLPPSLDGKSTRLAALRGPTLACTKCPNLVSSRTQVVFGVGNPEAELMFVGEAPGEDEDRQGEPFVGRAGQLLTKIIETMGFSRDRIYIANVLKCRPDMPAGASGNRPPTPDEMSTCLPYLEQQIDIIQPRVLVALGGTAVAGLLKEVRPMGQMRGRWHEFRGIPLMATYHPSYLLRSQALSEKRKVWEDMLLVLERLGLPVSEKQRAYFTKA